MILSMLSPYRASRVTRSKYLVSLKCAYDPHGVSKLLWVLDRLSNTSLLPVARNNSSGPHAPVAKLCAATMSNPFLAARRCFSLPVVIYACIAEHKEFTWLYACRPARSFCPSASRSKNGSFKYCTASSRYRSPAPRWYARKRFSGIVYDSSQLHDSSLPGRQFVPCSTAFFGKCGIATSVVFARMAQASGSPTYFCESIKPHTSLS